jgi:hypothetical protein
MASLTFSNALLPLGGTDTAEKVEANSRGFFGRLMDAMVASRRRAAEREIARLELVYGFKLRPDTQTDAELATKDLPFVR